MPELDADFEISTNNLEAEYEISEGEHFDCSFEIFAAGTPWGEITGNIQNQEDLQGILTDLQSDIDDVADDLSIETDNRQSADTDLQDNIDTVDGKIDTHIADKTNPHEVTKTQVGLGNVDNTSDLNKPISTATQTALNGKQNTINDLSEIRSNASNGQSAYNTIQNYGDIVTYDASDFATSTQGQKADTALQPNDNITELNNNAGYITSASLPTVNNSTVKFQKNGTDVETITLNQSTNSTVNFSIPTQASDINAVPTSRKVNNKALSSDITLTASDVNALSSSTTINDLTTTAQQNALNSGATTTNIGQITTNTNDIADINDLIPTQATSTNQLADKSFVNSSIATNTANFIGTFQSVAELEAYSGTLTNNDYAFVETTDTAGNTLFDRYKYTTATTPASWQYEYELNNSSFTANQWASINSGVTSGDVTLIGTALQPNDNVSSLVNDAGYITSSSLPTVNNGTLTIQQNGTDVQTFTANQSSNATANIITPTKTSDLTNDSGFIDNSALSNYATQTDLTNGLATKQDTLIAGKNINLIQRISYIENAGGTRINTGKRVTVDDFELDIVYYCADTGSLYLFQERDTGSSGILGITGSTTGGKITIAFGPDGSAAINSEITRTIGHTYHINARYDNGNATFTVDDLTTSETDTKTITYTIGYPETNLCLFSNSLQYLSAGNRILSAYFKQEGVYQFNYLPVKVDNTPYFYDTVSNSLISATNGSFVAGDEISGEVIESKTTSSDIITALGYTPYDSSNPDGYTTNTGTVQSVNNNTPDSNGNVSLTIPTVNDGVLTITQNGTSKGTFSANQSSNDTIALTDTTYNNFTGADGTNAGSSGLVPAPSATDNDKYLKGDGTWATVSSGSSTDVQINGTSITSGGVANIVTNSAYDASSNKIATMSDLPADEVFIATYGTTTFAEITNALSQGKAIICKNNNDYYSYITAANNSYYFTYATGGGYIFQIYVSSSNVWNTTATAMLEKTSNKTDTISSSSTILQYPSATAIINLLKTIYPVGSVYLSTNSTCPLSSLFGTWTLVSSGKALWTGTGSNGNTTIAAKLPNIKGQGYVKTSDAGGDASRWTGAFKDWDRASGHVTPSGTSKDYNGTMDFNASNYNSIYSDNATTVQPPAYVVNVWRRTA